MKARSTGAGWFKPCARRRALGLGASVLLAARLTAAPTFADLSLEELLNLPITSVSKKESTVHRAPAAIGVITRDDFARLGIASLPEALRLVPGMSVGRVTASRWAISARGFNDDFANKLLVLVDGRAVYTPAFGGVYWDFHDMPADNLERIEVVRGPGATLWGANAVNGVVNITSRSARETQGLLLSSTLGADQIDFTARYGGKLAPEVFYRAHVKLAEHGSFVDAAGADTPDEADMLQAGFRADGAPALDTSFTVIGNVFTGHSGEHKTRASLVAPHLTAFDAWARHFGANLLGKWAREFSSTSQLTVQAYYDHWDRNIADALNRETRHTGDFEMQHRLLWGARHDIVSGLGYRFSTDRLPSNFGLTWTPERQSSHLFNAFVQDEITLVPERLNLIVGTKAERNDATGWEIQPNSRVLWTPGARHTIWAAASHAVRTPSRFDRGARLNVAAFRPSPAGPPFLVSLFGNPHSDSEKLAAYELGYRFEASRSLAFDFAAFVNDYDQLLVFVAGRDRIETTPAPAHLLVGPSTLENVGEGRTHGLEASFQWQPTDRWKLAGSYSLLRVSVQPEEKGDSPEHQIQLRSYYDLPRDLQFNANVAHVSKLAGVDIPAYTRVDVGLRWRPNPIFEVGVWVHNLLDPQHPEFPATTSALTSEVPRSISARAQWRF